VATAGYLLPGTWGTLERVMGGVGLAVFALFVLVLVAGIKRARG
jgi:hypothetical protein